MKNKGLSPRVRGNQTPEKIQPDFQGSIPACAGQPPVRRHAGCMPGVYPRVCGATGAEASATESP